MQNEERIVGWEEAKEFLGIRGKGDGVKYKIPHYVKGKKCFYKFSDLIDFQAKAQARKRKIYMSHSKGRDGIQALVRTVLLFAVVESKPLVHLPGARKDDIDDARDFLLQEENWYTELLESIAEWSGFFRSCKDKIYKQGGVLCSQ